MGKVGGLAAARSIKVGSQQLQGRIGRVREFEQREVFGTDYAVMKKGLEVNDFVPVFRTIQNDGNASLKLAGLRQRENFHDLIQGAEPPRKSNQATRQLRKPQLAHEEVM